jgi:predicted nucleotidyltransferase
MTRRTFEETKESLEFMDQVDQLSKQQREHLRIVVKKIVQCYIDPKYHAVVVVGNDDSEQATLLTINADEMEAATILAKLEGMFFELNTVDAPPKEMMN